jgi:restriction endonuclease S subunit
VVDYPDPCAFAESLLLLVPDQEQILPDFLRLALVSASGHRSLTAVTSGSVISNIRPDALGGVEIRVPDLATQQRIVDAMRALEDAQEQMDNAATALRDMTQTFRDEIAAGHYEAGPVAGAGEPDAE